MKSGKHIRTIIGSVCIIISIVIIGCSTLTAVKVPPGNYNVDNPSLHHRRQLLCEGDRSKNGYNHPCREIHYPGATT